MADPLMQMIMALSGKGGGPGGPPGMMPGPGGPPMGMPPGMPPMGGGMPGMPPGPQGIPMPPKAPMMPPPGMPGMPGGMQQPPMPPGQKGIVMGMVNQAVQMLQLALQQSDPFDPDTQRIAQIQQQLQSMVSGLPSPQHPIGPQAPSGAFGMGPEGGMNMFRNSLDVPPPPGGPMPGGPPGGGMPPPGLGPETPGMPF